MFGYVRPYKPQLRIAEFDAYKGIYCGLCHQLGASFGPLARFTLSYDFAFLAALGIAIKEDKPCFKAKGCAFAPFKKAPCTCGQNPSIEFSADVAIIMLYHKFRDNQKDGKLLEKIGAALALIPATFAYNKAAKRQPEVADLIASAMLKQYALENDGCSCVDAACEPTALALSGICARLGDDSNRRILERIGYLLGRYVYMIDALDDLEQDLKNGNYNVFALANNLTLADKDKIDQVRSSAVGSLYLTLAEVGKAYDLLNIYNLEGIIENIIFLGLKSSVDSIVQERKLQE